MAKGVYIGVSDKARKVKKMYIGVDGVARRVKKAYIGVDGKARLFYSGSGTVTSKGLITNLQSYRPGCIGGSVGTHAIIAGGRSTTNSSETGSTDATGKGRIVSTYNTALTLGTAENLNTEVGGGHYHIRGESVGNYCVFMGKATLDRYTKTTIDNTAYDNNMIKYTVTGRVGAFFTTVSNGTHAIIAGKYYINSSKDGKGVDAYTSDLTLIQTATYPENCDIGTGTRVGNLGIMIKGKYSLNIDGEAGQMTHYNTIYAYSYDSSLTLATNSMYQTQTTPNTTKYSSIIDFTFKHTAAATAGDHGIFLACDDDNESNKVLSCNTSLTLSWITGVDVARKYVGASHLGEYAVFGGGQHPYDDENYDVYKNVDIYDSSLVHTSSQLSVSRACCAAANVGNYLLLSGGAKIIDSEESIVYFSNTTEAFEIIY